MWRRAGILAVALLSVLVGLPLMLAAALLVIGNTADGQRLIERTTERLTHGQVRLQGLSGRFPDRLHLSALDLRDAGGLWLHAEDLQLDTMPLELLSREARIDLLHAGQLDVLRSPNYGPSAPRPKRSSGGLWFREIRLDRLDVPRLELGAPLAGSLTTVKVSGSARVYSLQRAAVQLSAQRLDSVPSTYEVAAQVDGRHVDLRLDLQEDAGGPLTHLARVPELGALALHLRLSGPREAVQTALDLHAGPLVAAVKGTMNLTNAAADLRVDADSGSITPLFGVSWRQLALHGSWRGPPSAPQAMARLTVAGLAAPDVQANDLDATLHGEADRLLLDATVKGFQLLTPQLVIPDSQPIVLHGETRLADPARPIDFTLANAAVNIRGRWNLASVSGSASANVANIQPFVALGHLDLRGRGTLEVKFSSANHVGRLESHAELDISGGAAPLAGLLQPHARARNVLLFRPDGLEFQDTGVEAGNARASMSGTIQGGALNLNWKASLANLAALSSQLAGELSASGAIKGRSPALALDAEADGRLSDHGSAPGPLHLVVHTHDLPQRTQGTVQITGTLDAAPIELFASAHATADGGVAGRIERGDWKSAHLDGTLHVDPKGEHPDGRIELRVAQLSDLDRLLGQPLQGSIDASVALDERHGFPRAHVNLQAKDIGTPAQQLQDLQLHGHIDSPLTKPDLALRLEALAQLMQRPAHLKAEARGPLDKLALTAKLDLDAVDAGEGPVDAAAQFDLGASLNMEHSQLRLDRFTADYRKSNLQLLAPAVIDYGGGLQVDELRLGSADATLSVQGRLSPQLDAHIRLHDLTSAQLHALLPDLDMDGRVNARADLKGTLTQPLGHAELHAIGLRAGAGAARGLPATTVDLKVEFAADTAQVDLRMHAGQGLDLTASGQAPMNDQATMALQVAGAFDLNVLNPMLEAQGQRAQGTAHIDAQISGTPRSPRARGKLVLEGATFQDYSRGAQLTDIKATLSADGETLSLQLSAKAGSGTLSAQGTVNLGAQDWPVNLTLSGHDAQPLASDLVTANVDLQLTLTGELRGRLNVGGTVTVNRAVVNIPNALPPDIPTLHVVRPGQKPPPPPAPSRSVIVLDCRIVAPRAILVRGRGIDAEFGGEVHLRGAGPDLNVSGGFEMRQGRINLGGTTLQFDPDSRITFNGSGVEKKIDPTLDFTATSSNGTGASASLKVTGYADAPVITLKSVPEMPQDQILSQLLFGSANVSSLTTLQLAQVGAALVTLGGIGGNGGFNPLNTVQKTLGLDRLSIGGGGINNGSGAAGTGGTSGAAQPSNAYENAATIEAGRYVTNSIYVGAKQSTAGPTQAQVQIDLTKQLKLQATLGTNGGSVQGATPQNDPGSSAGFAYQFEY
jgi:translocation and assembly module TamB